MELTRANKFKLTILGGSFGISIFLYVAAFDMVLAIEESKIVSSHDNNVKDLKKFSQQVNEYNSTKNELFNQLSKIESNLKKIALEKHTENLEEAQNSLILFSQYIKNTNSFEMITKDKIISIEEAFFNQTKEYLKNNTPIHNTYEKYVEANTCNITEKIKDENVPYESEILERHNTNIMRLTELKSQAKNQKQSELYDRMIEKEKNLENTNKDKIQKTKEEKLLYSETKQSTCNLEWEKASKKLGETLDVRIANVQAIVIQRINKAISNDTKLNIKELENSINSEWCDTCSKEIMYKELHSKNKELQESFIKKLTNPAIFIEKAIKLKQNKS